MKIISVSDLHIWEDSEPGLTNMDDLCQVIRKEDPDIMIWLGDIFDRWRADYPEIFVTRKAAKLRILVFERKELGKRDILIPDNHAHGCPQWMLPEAEFMKSFRFGIVQFRHGWEWDWTWGGLGKVPGVAPLAFWISKKCPSLMVPIYDLLRKIKGSNPPSENKQEAKPIKHPAAKDGQYQTLLGKRAEQDWNLQVATIHTRAREDARKHDMINVLGHTHHPTPYDGLIVNSGDLDDRKYVRWTPERIELVDF